MPWVTVEDNEGNPTRVWQEDAAPAGMSWQQVDGGGSGGYDSRLVADTSKYQQKRSAKGGAELEIFNEDTGKWERGVYDIANPDILLPQSVAAQLGIRSAFAEGNVAAKSGLISELLSDPNFVKFATTALGSAYGSGAFDGLLGGGGAASGGAVAATEAAGDAALGDLLTGLGYGGEAAAAGGGSLTQLAQGYGGVSDVVPIVDGVQNAAQGLQLGTGGTGLSATGGMPSIGLQTTPGALEGLSTGLTNAGAATAADAAAASMGGSIAAGLTPAAAATVPNWLTGQGLGSGSSAGTGVSVPGINVPTTPTTGLTQGGGSGAPSDYAYDNLTNPSSGGNALPSVNNTPNFPVSAATGATTALQRIMSGSGTSADYLDILGKAAPGLISAFGSSQQASALSDLAAKADAYGAPSRARYEASMAPGFDPMSIPGYKGALDTSSDSILRRLSATGGNPFGNPGGLIEANKQIVSGTALPAIQQYQNQNANTGALGSLAASATGAATNAVGANNNVYSDLGSAFRSVTAPQQMSLSDFLKSINNGNMTA